MRRSIGIFVLAVGILLVVAGGIGAIVAGGAGGLGFGLAAWVILAAVGVLVIIGGAVLMRGAKPLGASEGRVGNYLAGEAEARFCDGAPYEVFFQPAVQGRGGHASQLTVRVAAPAPTTLTLRKETWFDRLGKTLGIAREHQTGDAEFDQDVYIRAASASYADLFLEHHDKRTAVLHLLDQGFQEVRLTGTDVEAAWVGFDPTTQDLPELPDDAARELLILAEDLPADDPEEAASQTDPRKFFKVLLWTLAIGFAIVLVGAFIYPPIRTAELLAAGFLAFAVMYPVFGILAGLLLHGRSTSHDQWGTLMGWGILLLGAGSVGAVSVVNALADTAPPSEHNSIISNKHISTGRRGSKTFYVTVPAWDRPGETFDFQVGADEYNHVAPGRSRLCVLTGPGWLGLEWRRAKHVIP